MCDERSRGAEHKVTAEQWDDRLVTFSEEEARRFEEAGVWGRRTLAQEFSTSAALHPENPAVIARDGSLAYRELDERSDRLAHALLSRGLKPRERVLLQLSNRLDTVTVWYGLLKAGLIPVATLAAHRSHEITEIARRSGAVAHIVEAGLSSFDLVGFAQEHASRNAGIRTVLALGEVDAGGVETIAALCEESDPVTARGAVAAVQAQLSPREPAVFQLSGGTTGVPKVIPRSHADYWCNARAYAEAFEFDARTRVAHAGPVVHNAGIVCAVHAPHSVGAATVLPGPDLREAVPFMVANGLTHVLLGRVNMRLPLEEVFAPLVDSLTGVIFSGGPVPEESFDLLDRRGVRSGQLFGMGEGLFSVSRFSDPVEVRKRTLGWGISPLDDMVIMEPGTERIVPDGSTGELVCTGPYTLRGYFDAADKNAEGFTADGWYRTGDLAVIENIEGRRCLRIVGRIKDMINRGGEKINASEVEALLIRHPRIDEAAVVAMPDERLGERACAFIAGGAEPVALEELRRHLDALGVAKYKWPERVEWIEVIPRTPVGKPDKKKLQAELIESLANEMQTSTAGAPVAR